MSHSIDGLASVARTPATLILVTSTLFALTLFVPTACGDRSAESGASAAERAGGAERKPRPVPESSPFLWRIETSPPSYLFGTIHVPDVRASTLSEAVDRAVATCDVVVTELRSADRSGVPDMRLPAGQTLAGLLPQALHERVQRYLKPARPAVDVSGLRIWAANLMLVRHEIMGRVKNRGLPVDMVISARGQGLGKQMDALETMAEQTAVFAALSVAEQTTMLESTLDQLETIRRGGRDVIAELVEVYLEGDLGKLARAMEELSGAMGNEVLRRKFNKLLLDDRNERMVERMVDKMKRAPGKAFFFAVGAAHYYGAKGIVSLLQKRGHGVARITAPGQVLPRRRKSG